MDMYIYIYIYYGVVLYIYIYICIDVYIYIYRERERDVMRSTLHIVWTPVPPRAKGAQLPSRRAARREKAFIIHVLYYIYIY